ncbi:MAG: hypothetical protein F6K24_08755 [Okeania sp. SIO2D1]|nr:hypothetical protein [Okeania sp. SIO2D1]
MVVLERLVVFMVCVADMFVGFCLGFILIAEAGIIGLELLFVVEGLVLVEVEV